ncbi:MAG: PadR family transcriptional regulator, partial [Pseudomonadota bacterium]
MNTRSICLAVLSFGEHSGYDIRKMLTEGPFSSFLAASYGSIYPALSQLESEGLIAGRDETESGRPTRRVFTITDQGQVALQADLLDVPKPDEIRSEFLLYAALSPRLPRDHIEAILSERIELMRRRLGEFEALAETEGKDCGSSA